MSFFHKSVVINFNHVLISLFLFYLKGNILLTAVKKRQITFESLLRFRNYTLLSSFLEFINKMPNLSKFTKNNPIVSYTCAQLNITVEE